MALSLIPEEVDETELVFREQADGRMVARLGGKVVFVDREDFPRVHDGESWLVRLDHRETYAIARLIKPCRDNPVLSMEMGKALSADLPPGLEQEGRHAGRSLPGPGPIVGAPLSSPAGRPAAVPAAGTMPDPREVVKPSDRVALFVDGANMDGSCRRAGYFVDYRKAREFFLAGGRFYAGYFYIADFTSSDPLQQRFLDFLARSGYIVRRKPVKNIIDEETGDRIIKCDLDTEIVLDMLNTVDNYDVAFLFSGDSDFERAVDLLRSRGKRVYVVTSDRQLSREMRYVADKPIFLLEECRPALIRDDQ